MKVSDRLDRIAARADAATQGPWESSVWPSKGVSIVHTADRVLLNVAADVDAEFIAHARTDVPELLSALRAVLDLHKPSGVKFPFNGIGDGEPVHGCADCMHVYPCPTVRAVKAALGVAA